MEARRALLRGASTAALVLGIFSVTTDGAGARQVPSRPAACDLVTLSPDVVPAARHEPAPRADVAPAAPNPAPQATPPAAADDATSLEQTIGLRILGGPLHVPEPDALVDLQPIGPGATTFVAGVPPVDVIDARGTHEGWIVSWTVEELVADTPSGPRAVAPDLVQLSPAPLTTVHGLPGGLGTGPVCAGSGVLGAAAPGSGGGTYQTGAVVTVDLPPELQADRVTLHLRFAIA